jgi:hypothetical protein
VDSPGDALAYLPQSRRRYTEALTVAQFRVCVTEALDEFWFQARDASPLMRVIHRHSCEDTLVDRYAEAAAGIVERDQAREVIARFEHVLDQLIDVQQVELLKHDDDEEHEDLLARRGPSDDPDMGISAQSATVGRHR